MSGPRLTQRKIDKLRDAINVVAECEEVQQPGKIEPGSIEQAMRLSLTRVRETCDYLERRLGKK